MAVASINQSMDHGWQGLFEPRNQPTKPETNDDEPNNWRGAAESMGPEYVRVCKKYGDQWERFPQYLRIDLVAGTTAAAGV